MTSLVVPLAVWEQIETPTVAGFTVTQGFLLVAYALLFLTTAGTALCLHLYKDSLRAAIRRASEAESPPPKQSDTGVENDES